MDITLYKIDEKLMALMAAIAEQDGEITPEQEQALAIGEYELREKTLDYGAAIMQLRAWVDMADKEAKRVTAIRNAYDKTADVLDKQITEAMEKYDIKEVKSPTMKMTLRKSVQTIIDDVDALPKQFKTIKVEAKPDKNAIKKAIQDGEIVEGAHLEERNNLQIK